MSINIKWLTNGEKKIYTVYNSMVNEFNIFENIEDIPRDIRHYAENIKEPTFCNPDLARIFNVQKVFYPGWPKKCSYPGYENSFCIAESCKYGGENKGWENCPYFSGEKWERNDE